MELEKADSLVMRLVLATRKEERHKLANPRGQKTIHELIHRTQQKKLIRLERHRAKIEDEIVAYLTQADA